MSCVLLNLKMEYQILSNSKNILILILKMSSLSTIDDKICKCKPGEKHCKKPTLKQFNVRENLKRIYEEVVCSEKIRE
jgi:hypothetical protein